MKRGHKVTNNKTSEDWYLVCANFVEAKKKKTKLFFGSFLHSDATNSIFESIKSQRTSYSRYLKSYHAGTLSQDKVTRVKKRNFTSVESKLVR